MQAYVVQYRQSSKKQIKYHDGTLVYYPADQTARLYDGSRKSLELITALTQNQVLDGSEICTRHHTIVIDGPNNAEAEHVAQRYSARSRPSAVQQPQQANPHGRPAAATAQPPTLSRGLAGGLRRPASGTGLPRVGSAKRLASVANNAGSTSVTAPPSKRSKTAAESVVATYRATWTDQKAKKHKSWNDGTCILLSNGRLELRRQDSDRVTDSLFVKKPPAAGEELEFDRVLVTIDCQVVSSTAPIDFPAAVPGAASVPAPPPPPMNSTSLALPPVKRQFTVPMRASRESTLSRLALASSSSAASRAPQPATPLHRFVPASKVSTPTRTPSDPEPSSSSLLPPESGFQSSSPPARPPQYGGSAAPHSTGPAQRPAPTAEPIADEDLWFGGDDDAFAAGVDFDAMEIDPPPPHEHSRSSSAGAAPDIQRPPGFPRDETPVPHASAAPPPPPAPASTAATRYAQHSHPPLVPPLHAPPSNHMPAPHVSPAPLPPPSPGPPPPTPALRLAAGGGLARPAGSNANSTAIAFSGVLRFRSNYAKNKRKQEIPNTFTGVQQYRNVFRSALFEHIQAQVTAVANEYTRTVDQLAKSRRGGQFSDNELQGACRSDGVAMHVGCRFNVHQMMGGNTFSLIVQDRMSGYSKDELWVVGTDRTFKDGQFMLSTFFGASHGVEMVSLKSFRPDANSRYFAIRLFQCNELAEIGHLDSSLDGIPLMPMLLNYPKSFKSQQDNPNSGYFACIPDITYTQLISAVADEYGLNAGQSEVLSTWANNLRTRDTSVTLVQGVFGSGKSHLVTVMVIFFHRALGILSETIGIDTAELPADLRVLLSSNTNVAVDRILESLISKDFHHFVRVGNLKKISKVVLPRAAASKKQDDLRDLLTKDIEQFGTNRLSASRVVGATCLSTLLECMDQERFGLVVLDECSQLTEPLSLLPLRFGARHLVCVGDPKQLPPTLESDCAHDNHLEKTLFDRLERAGCPVVCLRAQYRCHPQISRIANSLFYDNSLVDGALVDSGIRGLPPVVFVDVAGVLGASEQKVPRSNSYMNQGEARELMHLYNTLTRSRTSAGPLAPDVGVITLYRPQAQHLRTQLFPDCPQAAGRDDGLPGLVSTVDAFQGQEKPVVLVSLVRSARLGFCEDARRVNVLLTRARQHLVIFGNAPLMRQSRLWARVMDHCPVMPALAFRQMVAGLAPPSPPTCAVSHHLSEFDDEDVDADFMGMELGHSSPPPSRPGPPAPAAAEARPHLIRPRIFETIESDESGVENSDPPHSPPVSVDIPRARSRPPLTPPPPPSHNHSTFPPRPCRSPTPVRPQLSAPADQEQEDEDGWWSALGVQDMPDGQTRAVSKSPTPIDLRPAPLPELVDQVPAPESLPAPEIARPSAAESAPAPVPFGSASFWEQLAVENKALLELEQLNAAQDQPELAVGSDSLHELIVQDVDSVLDALDQLGM